MNVTNSDVAALASQANHLMAAKMFSLACCAMLYYDILITFGDEVEKIWKQRFSFATVLWFMNRYLSPLGYVVIIVSFHADWPKSVCNRYVLYPEILKVFTATAIGVIFILRLYSIYGGSMIILITISALLVGELVVKIWAFTDGTSVNLPPGLVGCILTGKDDANHRFVFTWVAELIFDTVIFILTLSRTLIIYRRHRQGAAIPLVKIMMRDGIIYFLVIFMANLVTVLLFVTLPPDLKAVNASFSTLITSLMVSRLILNLRSQAMRPRANVVSYPSSLSRPEQDRLTSGVIGNLGEPVENSWFDSEEKGEVDNNNYDNYDKDNEDENDEISRRETETETYAMTNLYTRKQERKKKRPSRAIRRGRGRIVVEVTQTRSVTSDVFARDRGKLYPDTDVDSCDSHGLRRQGFDTERGDVLNREGGSSSCCFSYSHEGGLADRTLSVSRSFSGEEHPQSARDGVYSHPYTHAYLRGNEEGSSERDSEEDATTRSSADHHAYSRTRRRGREERIEEEGEQRENDNPSGSQPRPGPRVHQGEWRPPPTWLLEDVDVCELGRPHRPRRPSTS